MSNIVRRISHYMFSFVASVGLFLLLAPTAHAATTNGRIIDDSVFDASGSMSAADIQTFLNGFPSSCLKSYSDDMPVADPTVAYFNYSGTGSAAQIIRRVADNWGINPRVLLTKLEQEENLVTGSAGCSAYRLASSVGFHCYDGANPRTTTFRGGTIQTCVDTDANMGLGRQLSKGGWLLKWGKERANGNLGWLVPDDGAYNYGGPMTQGYRKRNTNASNVYYDGYWNGVYMESGATASLYNYTPYLGQAFGGIWEGWWGAGSTYQPTFNYAYVSQSSDRSLTGIPSGQDAVLTVVVKNTGSTTWTNTGNSPVRLGPSRPTDRASQVYDASWLAPTRVGTMQEATAAPGENATFVFAIQVPLVGAQTDFREDFRLLIEGVTWLPDVDLHFNIRVIPSQFVGTVLSGALPTAMTAGNTASVSLSVRNDGNVSWYKTGRFPVKVGTVQPYNHNSVFDPNSWLSGSRPAILSQSEVAPGQTGTFTFSLKAPTTNSQYSESFSLVAEGLSWFSLPTLSSSIAVTGGQDIARTPVYRFYNPAQSVHFYTVDEAEKAAVQSNLGFIYEGIAFYGSFTNTGTPVYRTYNPVKQTHFFTTNLQERDWVVSVLGYWNEGISWYAASPSAGNPIYRLYSPSANTHFYTQSSVERDQAVAKFGFLSEGIGFNGF